MRPLILLAFGVFLHLHAASQSTEGKITYQITFGNNSGDYRMYFMWFTQSNYLYEFKNGSSPSLQPDPNKKYKSVEDSLKEAALIQKFKATNDARKQSWYGELASNVVVYSSFDNTNKKYCIRDTISFMEWQLQPDTMTIDNLTCQKAIGKYKGMNYTAWFAPSIPVSTALLQFRGLPGLLIRVTNNNTGSVVEMTELEWPAKNPIQLAPCADAPFISKQEMATIVNKQNAKTKAFLDQQKARN